MIGALLQTSIYERMRGLLGRLLDVDDMKHWYIHAAKIVVHPNYTHAGQYTTEDSRVAPRAA